MTIWSRRLENLKPPNSVEFRDWCVSRINSVPLPRWLLPRLGRYPFKFKRGRPCRSAIGDEARALFNAATSRTTSDTAAHDVHLRCAPQDPGGVEASVLAKPRSIGVSLCVGPSVTVTVGAERTFVRTVKLLNAATGAKIHIATIDWNLRQDGCDKVHQI